MEIKDFLSKLVFPSDVIDEDYDVFILTPNGTFTPEGLTVDTSKKKVYIYTGPVTRSD